jgi:putative membrane protein
MIVTKRFSLRRLIRFTSLKIIILAIYSAVIVSIAHFTGWNWMHIPWSVISLIGIAVAFYVGFKNSQSYDRTWEARKIWGAIVNDSRSWGTQVNNYISNLHANTKISEDELKEIKRDLTYRHIAWLYRLRRQLWKRKEWEHNLPVNIRYKDMFQKHFAPNTEEGELAEHLSQSEVKVLLNKSNIATQLIGKQAHKLKELRTKNLIDDFRHIEMQQMLQNFYTHQGKAERIKNFPLPRMYSFSSQLFVGIFSFLLPFAMMKEFVDISPNLIWLTIPATALVSWIFYIMEIIGDYAEHPFEGLAFDIPMTSLSRTIEIDLREMLGDTDIPKPIEPFDSAML